VPTKKDASEFPCPACGETVHAGALACPHCGADERSGWNEDAYETDTASSLGLDDDFDYESFVEDEFGGEPGKMARPSFGWFWWIVGVILAIAFAVIIFRG
jgi:hypothetical protein